jgi:hypothetical protein
MDNQIVNPNSVASIVRVPILVKVVAVFMWIIGIGFILLGIPLIILLGLGIIPIVLGYFNIKYSRSVSHLEYRGFKAALWLLTLGFIYTIVQIFSQASFSVYSWNLALIAFNASVLIYYRKLFIATPPIIKNKDILAPPDVGTTATRVLNELKFWNFFPVYASDIFFSLLAIIILMGFFPNIYMISFLLGYCF